MYLYFVIVNTLGKKFLREENFAEFIFAIEDPKIGEFRGICFHVSCLWDKFRGIYFRVSYFFIL